MTGVLVRKEALSAWGDMPGWNIVADLTPPELVAQRSLAVLRRRILMALVVVVLLCIGAYGYAFFEKSAASTDAATASDGTSSLMRKANSYAGITRIEAAVDQVRGQVGTVMQNDVDVAHAIAAIRAALPATMSIQSLALTLTATAGAQTGLDASGKTQIGTVTISGAGRTLDDLPAYVDRLAKVRGVVNVLPGSNQVTAGVAQFNLTAALTDQLYTHRYDTAKTGVK